MMAAAFFGWLLLSIALLFWQMRDGSFRVSSREPEMAFHSRPPLGFAVLMVGLPTFCLVAAFTPGAHTHNDQPVFILNAVLAVVIIVPLLLLLPLVQYVTLDKERLIYRLRTGGLLRPVVRSGPCSDLAGVYVREHRGNHWVYLGLPNRKDGSVMLGTYGRREKAEALAGEVARAVGLQVIAPPVLEGR